MSHAELFSALVREPFNKSIEEIRQLTDYQLRHIFFRPAKDSSGKGGDGFLTGQERFCKVWRSRGRAVLEKLLAKAPYNLNSKILGQATEEELLKRKWQIDYPKRPWDEVKGG